MISWLAGCVAAPDGGARNPYPLDDVLRFSDLQAKGTHNSYHVETTEIVQWDYTHAPLPTQLETQGVRQFELDVSWDAELGRHRVYHVIVVDEGTTCDTLTDCAADLYTWSRRRSGHHPLLVLVETKDAWDEATGPDRLRSLDEELLEAWPAERLVRPDDVQGDHPDLRTALAVDGWPTLRELRGKALFVVHDGGGWRDAYTADLSGRPMFPDAQGDEALPFAAVHTMNDPWDPHIADVVGLGHLVRTRCDADTEQARANDPAQRDQALASGAHFVSTDFPAPVDWTEYWVDVPGGTPSRCNPLAATADCTSEAIERPEDLVW